MNRDDYTDFGFQRVKSEEKAAKVAQVFHSVAAKYDVMNDLMSAGVHRVWKALTVEMAAVRPGYKVLDIAGGTGDLTRQFARRVGPAGQVILADINSAMLAVGRDKLLDQGLVGNIECVQADAQYLPFADNTFDVITIAFGLRNVTDKDKALASMLRVLRPGGQCLILEFSKPIFPWLQKIYDVYSFNVLPKIGQWVAQDAQSYQYLAESIRMHPDQNTLKNMMQTAGYEGCQYHNMTGGIVALHRGFKP